MRKRLIIHIWCFRSNCHQDELVVLLLVGSFLHLHKKSSDLWVKYNKIFGIQILLINGHLAHQYSMGSSSEGSNQGRSERKSVQPRFRCSNQTRDLLDMPSALAYLHRAQHHMEQFRIRRVCTKAYVKLTISSSWLCLPKKSMTLRQNRTWNNQNKKSELHCTNMEVFHVFARLFTLSSCLTSFCSPLRCTDVSYTTAKLSSMDAAQAPALQGKWRRQDT